MYTDFDEMDIEPKAELAPQQRNKSPPPGVEEEDEEEETPAKVIIQKLSGVSFKKICNCISSFFSSFCIHTLPSFFGK